jgi:hypothetical protein
MERFDDRTAANIEVVLESVCGDLPGYGGNHETRKYVAKQLVAAAKKGQTTLGALEVVGRQALQIISMQERQKAWF